MKDKKGFLPRPIRAKIEVRKNSMNSARCLIAACALAFSAVASAGESETTYTERFSGVFGDMPAEGFALDAMSVRYAGAATSGVTVGMNVESRCLSYINDRSLRPATGRQPYDIAIDLKKPGTTAYFAICSPFPSQEDTTVDFLDATGASVQKNVYPAGAWFHELAYYTGSRAVSSIVIHGGGLVYVDNIIYSVAN
jgi:hypothetical protein